MPIATSDASVALFSRALRNLAVILRKAEQQAAERDLPVAELLQARLGPAAPDTLTLAEQVHWAAEGARRAVGRMTGVPDGGPVEEATSFAELHERIDAVLADLGSVPPEELEAGLSRAVELRTRGGVVRFTGDRFLLDYAIPHFTFHCTCAYTILRREGIALTMGDFLFGADAA